MLNKIVSFIVLFFLSYTSFAQAKASKFTVEGIQVIFKPTVKEVINVAVYYRGGVAEYPKDKAGLGNLALAGAPECGTRQLTKDQFKDKEDQFGISINGVGSYDYGKITLNCISKYFDEGWELLEQAVMSPVYDAMQFEILKQRQLSSVRENLGDPDGKITDLAIETTFTGTPYATKPQGDTASLPGISASEAKDYYFKQLLNKNRMFIVVAGNISKEKVTGMIRQSFAKIPEGPYKEPAYHAPEISSNDIHVEARKLATNYIAGTTNAALFTAPDYVPFRLAVVAYSDRLFEEIRTKRNLSYAPYAYVQQLKMPFAFIFVSTTEPKASVEVMANELKRLAKQGFSQKEYNASKNLYITANYTRQESSAAIAAGLGSAEILGNWKIAEDLAEMIRKTTPAQMTTALHKYVNGINWNYLGDETKAEEAKEAFEIKVR